MALHVDMASNRKRLVVIMQQDIAEDDLTDSIRHYMNNFTYLMRDAPFVMKRPTYRLAQNTMGGNDDDKTPLLLGDGVINYGTKLIVIMSMCRKLCKLQQEYIK